MSPVIVALDFPSCSEALALAEQLDPTLCRVKVGKELFTRSGPQILKDLHRLGLDVFLDLKFHDIPNTCAQAVLAAADQGVWMVNVHASGGRRMMEAARERLQQHRLNTRLIAVTVLTSMEQADLAEVGLDIPPQEQVKRLAMLTQECGLDGVVCSAQEASMLTDLLGAEFLKVTPGIRPAQSVADDQRRVMTPTMAMTAGSTHLVMGRPITRADNPQQALEQVIAELQVA
ncbi:orotidine 5'-phosphate decarboxylase [Terasakiispira papahanaumokuakeensis]|uniref:Orotidine 5'-phosphate decarboxylase n=1 Tax=Terasakiispira papahanaumokuakeensis TaxID=197479 RepID=A0A1E2V9T2_9GAMM|nr:orotidine-5'-phosphate decarboxylase [Terasakiispira papahanaumokuakeensis]ODC03779.1 orotidine 5'-phosphate decarboxylase [Terasakiispira papahanaumokuakeensis]